MNSPRVLIIDDDEALLRSLTGALRLRMPDVCIDVCVSGLAALSEIAKTEYDAIVTDVKMPGMDGLTLLKEIRKARPETPTLLITGHGQHDLAVQALRGGAFDFIQKPIERDYFIASLQRAIRIRQLSRQVQQQQTKLEEHAAVLEKTVQKRTRQLRDANRHKDEFLAALSHELRNPLACILHSVELLNRANGAGAEASEFCDIIQSQTRQLSRLIDDLLDVSKLAKGKVELRKNRFRLADAIENAVAATQSMMATRNHQLEVGIEEDAADICLYGDEARVEQIVVNLLQNAAKYTDSGGKIRLAVWMESADAVLEVQDNGIGIRQEMLPRIFEPFVQAETSSESSDSGLGIGLSLVQRFANLHGGSISAFSEGPGRGSCFTLRLPADSQPTLVAAQESEPAVGQPTPRRIVIADDVVNIARLMQTSVEQYGHTVVAVVNDGVAAIDAIEVHAPDVALLDIGLPGIDGYEVAREIRRRPELSKVSLVAVSGYGMAEDRRRSFAAGFDYHLVKPVKMEVLISAIEGKVENVPFDNLRAC